MAYKSITIIYGRLIRSAGPIVGGMGYWIYMKRSIENDAIFFSRLYNDAAGRNMKIWNKSSGPARERNSIAVPFFLIQ